MKIGVISDTHDLLRDEVKTYLNECDLILHAGDHSDDGILYELKSIAEVYSVCGNCDYNLYGELPHDLSIRIDNVNIYMIHDEEEIRKDISDRDLIITGHTHKYSCYEKNGKTYLNPGSCGPRRYMHDVTMAYLITDGNGGFIVQKIDLLPEDSAQTEKKQMSGYAFIDKILIKKAMKDINAGYGVSEIAKRHNISKETAETICRMYLTHPGVDADGIMSRMGF